MDSAVSARVLRRAERELAQKKVLLRHLPPDYTLEKLHKEIDPVPANDYFTFVPGDPTLGKFGCSRAYINFKNVEDIVPFRDIHDGKVLETENGNKYRLIMELSPFQGIPKSRGKLDHRCGTLADDAEYKQFVEEYDREIDPLPSVDITYLHEVKTEANFQATPLTNYIKDKYSAPRSHRGGSHKTKVLYASGSRKKREKVKDVPKSKGSSSSRKEKRHESSSGKGDRGHSHDTTAKVVVEKLSRKQNGIREDETSKPKLTTGEGSPSSRSKGRPDQAIYVVGGKRERINERRDERGSVSTRGERGRRKIRDTYGKYGGSYYNDRHDNRHDHRDNQYNFKEEDDDFYQGPDHVRKESSGRYYGRGRSNDRYGNSSYRTRS